MDIYFTAQAFDCNQYQPSESGELETAAAVIAPLRVEGTGTEKLKVINGCNLFQGCHNPNCFYSIAARERSRLGEKSAITKKK